jgi:hypothetical protein
LCAVLLARKPVVISTTAASLNDDEQRSTAGQNAEVATIAATTSAASMADVDVAVGNSLDALKERIFRLELRHQAGTISQDEYTTERAKVEQLLRKLVRG